MKEKEINQHRKMHHKKNNKSMKKGTEVTFQYTI